MVRVELIVGKRYIYRGVKYVKGNAPTLVTDKLAEDLCSQLNPQDVPYFRIVAAPVVSSEAESDEEVVHEVEEGEETVSLDAAENRGAKKDTRATDPVSPLPDEIRDEVPAGEGAGLEASELDPEVKGSDTDKPEQAEKVKPKPASKKKSAKKDKK